MDSKNHRILVERFWRAFLAVLFVLSLSACTSAGTDVVSLVTNLKLFKLNSHEIRITSLSEISNIKLDGDCHTLNQGFEYDLTNGVTESWTPLPTSPDSVFTAIDNQCADQSRVSFTLNLSSTPPFSTMGLGDSYVIKIRDINIAGFSNTEIFRVTYSNFNLASGGLILGQGPNILSCSGAYCLKGRVVGLSNLDTTTLSSTYTLKGKVIFK